MVFNLIVPVLHKSTQIYGRGSVDMLCTVAAHAVVFARIAKAKVPLKGTLLFCAVSDEEAGGRDGAGCVLLVLLFVLSLLWLPFVIRFKK